MPVPVTTCKSERVFKLQRTNADVDPFYTVFRKKHPLTFSFISPWKILRFTQNFQGMFTRNEVSADIKIKYSLLPMT